MDFQEYSINLKQDETWQMHKLHFHETLELMLVLNDGGALFINNAMYPLRKNMVLVLKENVLHRSVSTDDKVIFRRYVLHILPGTLQKLSTSETNFYKILHNCTPCIQLDDGRAKLLCSQLEELRTPSDPNEFGADIRRRITLLEILILISGSVQYGEVQTGVRTPDYEKVLPILSYIQDHFTEQFTIDELADHFHLSKYYLCHMFKKGTGFSVMEYVIQMRILEAQKQLRKGCSVQEAGDLAGFQSYAHFIRTFNNYIGTSPKQYAKQYSQGVLSVVDI